MSDGETVDDDTGAESMTENGGGNRISKAIRGLWSGNSDSDDTQCVSWGLSKKERIIGFFTCLLLGLVCFGLALALTPVIVLKSRKFAALFTMGSLFSLGSFSFLWGPWEHFKHLMSLSRLPFTVVYVATAVGTLYSALVLHYTVLTIIMAVAQILALLWFLVGYVPGGTTGLTFMAKLFSRLCTSTISSAIDV